MAVEDTAAGRQAVHIGRPHPGVPVGGQISAVEAVHQEDDRFHIWPFLFQGPVAQVVHLAVPGGRIIAVVVHSLCQGDEYRLERSSDLCVALFVFHR